MTAEEAIRLLHPDTSADAIAEIRYYHGFNGKDAAIMAINEACVMACEALEKQTANAKLKEYENLEEKGLLLRLPCKVGDTLYHILACTTAEGFGKKYVDWFIVTHITIDTTKEVSIMGRDICNREWGVNSRGIGKTLFLTRTEAEAKLKELEGE